MPYVVFLGSWWERSLSRSGGDQSIMLIRVDSVKTVFFCGREKGFISVIGDGSGSVKEDGLVALLVQS
jgi:hypothetical protein